MIVTWKDWLVTLGVIYSFSLPINKKLQPIIYYFINSFIFNQKHWNGSSAWLTRIQCLNENTIKTGQFTT